MQYIGAQLTSYQFDIAGMTVRMLDCVLTPHRGRPATRGHRTLPVTGVLIRRESLGAAGTAATAARVGSHARKLPSA